MNSKTKKQFRLCGARNGARKRGEECAQILMENLPGDTTQDEIKKMFSEMRGNIYLDLRSDHGRQAKDKDDAWTRTCHANIRCSEVSAALKAKELYNGRVLRRGHVMKVTILHLHDDLWFWMNDVGEIDIYTINVSCYDFLSIVISFDCSLYFAKYGAQFMNLNRMITDGSIVVVIPPCIDADKYADNNGLIEYIRVCSLCRLDSRHMSMDKLKECDVPQLLIFREVHVLAEHCDSFSYLLPFGLDNDLWDMLLSMDIMDKLSWCNNDCYRSSDNAGIPVLCSQGPGGTFSHSKGGYINSYDFQCPIGTPVIAPRDGIITDIMDHHKKHGTDLIFEKKCNYVTILHSDGSQCDLVHLRYKSIQFEKGDYVKAGDLIAYSGNTGFSGEPHIHMMVYVNRLVDDAVHWQSIPIKFKLNNSDCNPCTATGIAKTKVTAGHRYIQRMKSLYLDPLLIPTDRIQCSDNGNAVHVNWNDIDYTESPNIDSELPIRLDINDLVYYTVAEISTLQCDMIIVPLSVDYIMNNWCCCRVMRRGGTKLMKELMKRGYDLLHTVGLKKSCHHCIRFDNVNDNKTLFVLSGYDQLASKKIMFVCVNGDDDIDTFSETLINDIFAYLCTNHDGKQLNNNNNNNNKRLNNRYREIQNIAIELPLFNSKTDISSLMCAIRNGLIQYIDYVGANDETTLKQFYICAQSLHDLHCYSAYIGACFPRRKSGTRNTTDIMYIPHCPCAECSSKVYGLGKLHEKYKIKLHQEGIDNDSCSGVADEYLYLKNVYKAGDTSHNNNTIQQATPASASAPAPTPAPAPPIIYNIDNIDNIDHKNKRKRKRKRKRDDIDDDEKRRKKKSKIALNLNMFNIYKCISNDNLSVAIDTRTAPAADSADSHLLSLIAQQWQLDLHTQRCLIYQQFERWRYIAEGKHLISLKEIQKSELHRLQMLRTMQYTQQMNFQKSKKNDRMIIAEKHGVVGSADHMNCIPLTPNIRNINHMIQCIAPKRQYYMDTISKINLTDVGFAQINLKQKQMAQQVIAHQHQQQEQQRKLQMQQQLQQHLQLQQLRMRQIQQQQQLRVVKSVNADNFAKVQNIINMMVKNKMAFCGNKINSSQHAIHHVTNCAQCMATLERAKTALFK